jgi:hypothetical protein
VHLNIAHNASSKHPHALTFLPPSLNQRIPPTFRPQVSPTAIQSRLSLLFFAIMFVMLGNQQAIPSVFEDRLLYYREKGAHVYGAYRCVDVCVRVIHRVDDVSGDG